MLWLKRQRSRDKLARPATGGASDAASVVATERVTKEFLGGRLVAIDDISFELEENRVTAMIGPSGCGKTTMLRLIAGLDFPSRGRVMVDGQPVIGPGPDRGMVFQAYTSFPWLTVRHNIEYGMKVQGIAKEERRTRAQHFLEVVHLENFSDAYPAELSGGMKQRVAIARTLAQNPRLLLLDEPFGALDAQVRWEMEEMIIEIITRENKTVILVTHDIQEAIYLADRILFYTRQPGRIKADLQLEFKQGKQFPKKEDLLGQPGYVEMERRLFAMMRDEIQGKVS